MYWSYFLLVLYPLAVVAVSGSSCSDALSPLYGYAPAENFCSKHYPSSKEHDTVTKRNNSPTCRKVGDDPREKVWASVQQAGTEAISNACSCIGAGKPGASTTWTTSSTTAETTSSTTTEATSSTTTEATSSTTTEGMSSTTAEATSSTTAEQASSTTAETTSSSTLTSTMSSTTSDTTTSGSSSSSSTTSLSTTSSSSSSSTLTATTSSSSSSSSSSTTTTESTTSSTTSSTSSSTSSTTSSSTTTSSTTSSSSSSTTSSTTTTESTTTSSSTTTTPTPTSCPLATLQPFILQVLQVGQANNYIQASYSDIDYISLAIVPTLAEATSFYQQGSTFGSCQGNTAYYASAGLSDFAELHLLKESTSYGPKLQVTNSGTAFMLANPDHPERSVLISCFGGDLVIGSSGAVVNGCGPVALLKLTV